MTKGSEKTWNRICLILFIFSISALILITGFDLVGYIGQYEPSDWQIRALAGFISGILAGIAVSLIKSYVSGDLQNEPWYNHLFWIIFIIWGIVASLVGWLGENTGFAFGFWLFVGTLLLDGTLAFAKDVDYQKHSQKVALEEN